MSYHPNQLNEPWDDMDTDEEHITYLIDTGENDPFMKWMWNRCHTWMSQQYAMCDMVCMRSWLFLHHRSVMTNSHYIYINEMFSLVPSIPMCATAA